MIKNAIKHLITITKHKWYVLILCIRAGIPIRGLIHDLSKYSPTEFFESIKYFQGTRSPITKCKELNGYSKAWLHHKGRNKHHYEYWYDYDAPVQKPIIPYKYTVEMICDNLAAGIVYNGKQWTNGTQLTYFDRVRKKERMNENIEKLLLDVYTQISEKGIKKVVKKKILKELYNKYCSI